jgi:hypothetical protein
MHQPRAPLWSGGTLAATLTVAASTTEVGFTLRITNPESGPVTLQFTSGQQFDFHVRRLDGAPLWSWSTGRLFSAMLQSRTLAPGETATYTGSWTPTERGSFLAEGRLISSSHRAAATAGFTVP